MTDSNSIHASPHASAKPGSPLQFNSPGYSPSLGDPLSPGSSPEPRPVGQDVLSGSESWYKYLDESSGHFYYWNSVTNETTWTEPVSYHSGPDDEHYEQLDGGGGEQEDDEAPLPVQLSTAMEGLLKELLALKFDEKAATDVLHKVLQDVGGVEKDVSLGVLVGHLSDRKHAELLSQFDCWGDEDESEEKENEKEKEKEKERESGNRQLGLAATARTQESAPMYSVAEGVQLFSQSARFETVSGFEVGGRDGGDGEGDGAEYEGNPSDAMLPHYKRFAAALEESMSDQERILHQAKVPSSNAPNLASELRMKFSGARAILRTFEQDIDVSVAPPLSDSVLSAIRWGRGMRDLNRDILTAFSEGRPFDGMKEHYGGGLLAWYRELEVWRIAVGPMLCDEEMVGMAESDEADGSLEGELHALLHRAEDIFQSITELRALLKTACMDDSDISMDRLEELYLYLREQIAGGADLDAVCEEMHENVYNIISSHKAGEVLSYLIDIFIFEDEQEYIKLQIQELIGTGGDDALPVSLSLDMQHEIESYKQHYESSQHEAHVQVISEEEKWGESQPMAHAENVQSVGGTVEDSVAAFISSYSNALKDAHRCELAMLHGMVERERDQKLKAVEDKLMRKKVRKRNEESSQSRLQDRKVIELLDKEIEEIECDVEAVTAKYKRIIDGLSNGFKKKCLTELNFVKKLTTERRLDVSDKRQCGDQCAEALKKRFLRDCESMLESLQQDRAAQHSKLQSSSRSRTTSTSAVHWVASDAERVDEHCNAQETQIMQYRTEGVLLALVSIKMDASLLDMPDAAEDGDPDEQEDKEALAGRWLERANALSETYGAALRDLQSVLRLRTVALAVPSGENGKAARPCISQLAYHRAILFMTKVSIEALHEQLREQETAFGVGIGVSTEQESDRFRLVSCVTDQFDRHRSELDGAQELGEDSPLLEILDLFLVDPTTFRRRHETQMQRGVKSRSSGDDEQPTMATPAAERPSRAAEIQSSIKKAIVQGANLWRQEKRDECYDMYLGLVEQILEPLQLEAPGLCSDLTVAVASAKELDGAGNKSRGAVLLRKALDKVLVALPLDLQPSAISNAAAPTSSASASPPTPSTSSAPTPSTSSSSATPTPSTSSDSDTTSTTATATATATVNATATADVVGSVHHSASVAVPTFRDAALSKNAPGQEAHHDDQGLSPQDSAVATLPRCTASTPLAATAVQPGTGTNTVTPAEQLQLPAIQTQPPSTRTHKQGGFSNGVVSGVVSQAAVVSLPPISESFRAPICAPTPTPSGEKEDPQQVGEAGVSVLQKPAQRQANIVTRSETSAAPKLSWSSLTSDSWSPPKPESADTATGVSIAVPESHGYGADREAESMMKSASLPVLAPSLSPKIAGARARLENRRMQDGEGLLSSLQDSLSTTLSSPMPGQGQGPPSTYKQIVEYQDKQQKDLMTDEVKRISMTFNEEKQKLDLKLKIEQARQKTALQRKLFEKRDLRKMKGA